MIQLQPTVSNVREARAAALQLWSDFDALAQLCVPCTGAGREPATDWQDAGPPEGADHGALRPPRP